MVSNAIAVNGTSIMEDVIVKGDLAKLSPDERARYYTEVCQSMGLNSLTQPFQYLNLNNKLTLYATKTATDQLRTVKQVSVFKIDAETVEDLRIVHAYARDASGREDMDIGVVNVKGLQGEALANAYMKALTKAKRRVTLSICGLGWLDDSEVDSIPQARRVNVDTSTGEIIDSPGDAAVAEVEVIEHPDPMITEAQIRKIRALQNRKGLTNAGLKELHGKSSSNDLTRREASALIDEIDAYPDVVVDDQNEGQAPLLSNADPDKYTR